MTYPAGITPVTGRIGKSVAAVDGDAIALTAVITPVILGVKRLTHVPTGDQVALSEKTIKAVAGEAVTFQVIPVDHPNLIDGAGNTVTGWAYKVSITQIYGPKKSLQLDPVYWSPLASQTGVIDVDLIPDGSVAAPELGNIPAVITVAGETGDVSAADIFDAIHGDIAAQIAPSAADATQALLLSRGNTYVDLALPIGDQLALVKADDNPQLQTDDTDLPSLDWPWIFQAYLHLEDRLDDYYMYFATDHGQAVGRVALATAPDLEGPWTYRGTVYQFNTTVGGSGNETETPAVVWDEPNQRIVMYHQQVGPTGAVAAQVTMRATSTDGVAWTPGGIALDIPSVGVWPAPGHTGYFRPFRIGETWVAYSLLSGTTLGQRFALSYSTDGARFELDPRPLGYGAEYLGNDRVITWNTSSVVLWRGRYLWIGIISTFASGAEDRVAEYYVAPLADDFRSFTGAPRKLFEATQPWESDHMSHGHAFIDKGRLVLMYRSGEGDETQQTGFGLAITEAAI
jgi:hypothetical protein